MDYTGGCRWSGHYCDKSQWGPEYPRLRSDHITSEVPPGHPGGAGEATRCTGLSSRGRPGLGMYTWEASTPEVVSSHSLDAITARLSQSVR